MEIGGITPNLLDAVLLLLLVYVFFRGWRQGSVSQIAAFGGLAVRLLVGMWAAPWIGGLFIDEPGRGLAPAASDPPSARHCHETVAGHPSHDREDGAALVVTLIMNAP